MTRTELIDEIRLVLGEVNPTHVEVAIDLINQFCDEMQETTNSINRKLEVMEESLDSVLRELRK